MIPIAKPNFIETRAVENPLLKVPPASRGNRTGAVPLAKRGEPEGAGKGTTVRHEVFEAGAIFPSASVNRQVRCIALTPFVPLSRLRERGNALQGAPPCAPTPLSHSVGEGLGVRAKKRARLAHSELKRCTLIRPEGGGRFNPACAIVRSKERVLATLVSMSLALCAWAQGGETLTLQEAVALALRDNRAVQISARSVDKTRNALREARSNANFTIQGNATYTRFDRVAEARFGPQPVRIGNLENRTARITLTQVVDISGIIRTAIRAANLTLTVSELEFERTRNDTILQVVQAYQGVARADEFVRVAEEALRNAQERLRLIRAQVDAGVAAQFDLLRAETAVAQAEQAVLNARNQRELAAAALNNLLGRDLNTPVQVAKPERLPELQLPPLETLTQQAFQNRPELIAAQRGIELAQVGITSARRSLLPNIVLTGQADFNLNTSVFNPRRETYTGVAVLSVPIWDGGTARAREAQARDDLEIAQLRLKQAQEGVALEVRQAYLNLQDAQKRLEVARKGLEQATEALRLARVRFEAGVSPQLEISDAELAFTQAQTNLVNAQFDYLDAYAALLRAIGAIDEQYTRL
jgi:outer membrane protein